MDISLYSNSVGSCLILSLCIVYFSMNKVNLKHSPDLLDTIYINIQSNNSYSLWKTVFFFSFFLLFYSKNKYIERDNSTHIKNMYNK